jgi:hypothetical protein
MAVTEHPHGRALDLDARRPIPGRREFFRGPVRSIKVAALRSLLDPALHRGRQRLGKPSWLAWCPGDGQARQALFLILLEPQAHRGTMHPQVLGDHLALPPAMGHQDGLAPVAEAAVIGRFEDLFQLGLLCGRQPNPPHLFPPSREKRSERVSQKRCKVIRCVYQTHTRVAIVSAEAAWQG